MATVVGPLLSQLLTRYGLGSLAPWLAERIIKDTSEDQILLELYDRPEFKARFPAIAAREKAGLPPVSIDEYLSYESTLSQVSRAFGVTLTKEEVDGLLAVNVSAQEAQERLGMAAKAVFQSPPELRSELERNYGVGSGDLVRFWLDPKKELPVLQRRFVSAEITGAAIRAGFDQPLSAAQGERLYEAGLTGEAALEGFGQLVEADELFQAVDVTEDDIGLDDQLSLLAGNTDLAQQVETRGERRVARFKEGGGFSTGREGIAGLGSAARS